MKQFTRLLLLLTLCAAPVAARPKGGPTLLDSLLAELPKMRDDTPAVMLLDDIAYAYSNANPNEGIAYAQRALSLSRRIGWRKGEALAHNDLGNCYQQKAAYALAMEHYFQALRRYDQ